MSRFKMDPDVARVLVFMQTTIRAPKLLEVAHGVAEISDLIWTCYVKKNTDDPLARYEPFRFLTGDDTFTTCSSEQLRDTTAPVSMDLTASTPESDGLHKTPL